MFTQVNCGIYFVALLREASHDDDCINSSVKCSLLSVSILAKNVRPILFLKSCLHPQREVQK